MADTKLLLFAVGSERWYRLGQRAGDVDNPSSFGVSIVGMVSTHPHGSVYWRAQAWGVRFFHWRSDWRPEVYGTILDECQPDQALSLDWPFDGLRHLSPRTRLISPCSLLMSAWNEQSLFRYVRGMAD